MPQKRYPVLVLLLAVQLCLVLAANAAARTISWSGYTWDVRPAGTGEPGPNAWSDSGANVQVSGTDLLLSIVKNSSGTWTSSEVDNQQHLGYGTYRWVVGTDLSALDANEVLGMFTYGGSDPSNNEIDIEPSHWGNLSWPTGSVTVWQDAGANVSEEKDFNYSNHPPYVNQFTWSPGKIAYLITDATGATLLNWTVTSGVPTPSTEVPMINYWRYNGVPPAGVRTMRVLSFAWAPLGQSPSPVGTGVGSTPPPVGTGGGPAQPPASTPPAHPAPGSGSPPATAGPSGTGSPRGRSLKQASTCAVAGGPGASKRRVAVSMSLLHRRFVLTHRRREGVILWTSNAAVRLRLVIRRFVHRRRSVIVGVLRRRLHAGSGRLRLPATVHGRHMRPGTYAVSLAAGAAHARCSPVDLRFTVLAR